MDSLKLFTGLSLIFVLISLGTVLSIVWTMEDFPAVLVREELCLPIDRTADCQNTPLRNFLETAISKEYNRTKKEEKDNLDAYFKIEENKLRLQSVYDADDWEMIPTARITGKSLEKKLKNKNATEMEPIRNWRHGRELTTRNGFLNQGIRYHRGRLVVPVSGTYFIYSYVDFHESCISSSGRPDVDNISIPLKHGIYKFSIHDEEEKQLILSYQPHKLSINRHFNRYSSYITYLAELKAGDEISVKVSNITNIDNADNNFFGINLI